MKRKAHEKPAIEAYVRLYHQHDPETIAWLKEQAQREDRTMSQQIKTVLRRVAKAAQQEGAKQ